MFPARQVWRQHQTLITLVVSAVIMAWLTSVWLVAG